MLVIKPAVTTDEGINLQILNMRSEPVEFTKLEVGCGQYSDDEATEEALQKRTSLKAKKQQFGISHMTVTGNTLILSSLITNAELDEGYTIREFGLYARVKDQPETERMVSISLADVEDDFPAYDGMSESKILMRYQFAVSNARIVYLSYEHGPVALAEEVDAKIQLLEGRISELQKNLKTFSQVLDNLLPGLEAPTETDAGKIIKIDADGQAVWAEDYGSSWKARYPEFLCDTDADISDKAHIVETDGFGYRKTTDRDGKNIIETLYGPDGEKIVQKQTVIDSELITGRLVDDEAQEQKE